MKQLSFLLVLAALLFACKKQDEHPIHAGEYFHCKVDGRDWYASKDGDMFAQAVIATILGDTVLGISAYSNTEVIDIYCYNKQLFSQGNHVLGSLLKDSADAGYDNDLSTKEYRTDSMHRGILNISLIDPRRKLVEGTFSFSALHPVTFKTVNVTDGFFSIEYIPH